MQKILSVVLNGMLIQELSAETKGMLAQSEKIWRVVFVDLSKDGFISGSSSSTGAENSAFMSIATHIS